MNPATPTNKIKYLVIAFFTPRIVPRTRRGAQVQRASFEVSPSSVINWLRRWRDDGSSAAKPSGGSVSPLEKNAGWLLALIAKHPDLTLDEVVTAMRRRRIVGSRSALSRFFHPAQHHL